MVQIQVMELDINPFIHRHQGTYEPAENHDNINNHNIEGYYQQIRDASNNSQFLFVSNDTHELNDNIDEHAMFTSLDRLNEDNSLEHHVINSLEEESMGSSNETYFDEDLDIHPDIIIEYCETHRNYESENSKQKYDRKYYNKFGNEVLDGFDSFEDMVYSERNINEYKSIIKEMESLLDENNIKKNHFKKSFSMESINSNLTLNNENRDSNSHKFEKLDSLLYLTIMYSDLLLERNIDVDIYYKYLTKNGFETNIFDNYFDKKDLSIFNINDSNILYNDEENKDIDFFNNDKFIQILNFINIHLSSSENYKPWILELYNCIHFKDLYHLIYYNNDNEKEEEDKENDKRNQIIKFLLFNQFNKYLNFLNELIDNNHFHHDNLPVMIYLDLLSTLLVLSFFNNYPYDYSIGR